MALNLDHRAKDAFLDDEFDLAVDLYTQALDMDPNNADLFADRAQANIKLQNYTGSHPFTPLTWSFRDPMR